MLAGCDSHIPSSPGNDHLEPPPTIDPPVNELANKKIFDEIPLEVYDKKYLMRRPQQQRTTNEKNEDKQ